MDRLQRVLGEIDRVNAADPNRENARGDEVAKEWIYGRRMSERLAAMADTPSDELQIACRAQHIARWRIPRSDYPMDRKGYKKWRRDLAAMHADLAGEIMVAAGYDETARDRVKSILQKEGLKVDAEVQTLEDCACLVFLEHYFDDFRAKHEREKVISILQKTWKKMSPSGHEAAVKLQLSPEAAELVQAALS